MTIGYIVLPNSIVMPDVVGNFLCTYSKASGEEIYVAFMVDGKYYKISNNSLVSLGTTLSAAVIITGNTIAELLGFSSLTCFANKTVKVVLGASFDTTDTLSISSLRIIPWSAVYTSNNITASNAKVNGVQITTTITGTPSYLLTVSTDGGNTYVEPSTLLGKSITSVKYRLLAMLGSKTDELLISKIAYKE